MKLKKKPTRNLFAEMMEGVQAIKAHREGKITLRTHTVEVKPLPKVDAAFIRKTRKSLNVSRSVFARQLHINERTLEKWEQNRAKPNPQAATLLMLVKKHPDTLQRLQKLSA